MAKTYTLPIPIRFWKRHTCPVCDCVYRYKLIRDKSAQAQSEDGVRKAADKILADTLRYETEKHSCPSCGTQPVAVIAARRSRAFTIATWVGLLAVATAAILGAAVNATMVMIAPWGAALIGILATIPALLTLNDPNTRRSENRTLAEADVSNGRIIVEQEGDPAKANSDDVDLTKSPLVPAVILIVASLACIAAEGMRMASGWPTVNVDYSPNPVVAGPGDTINLYVGPGFSSVKGYWRARADYTVVTILEDSEVPLEAMDEFRIKPDGKTWGKSISFKGSATETAYPSANVTIPDTAEYAGKVLSMRIEMNIKYPSMVGSSSFSEYSKDVSQDYRFTLGPPGCGSTYNLYWKVGLGMAALLFLVVGGMTASRWGSLREHESDSWPIKADEA